LLLGGVVRLVHELPGQWSAPGNLGGPWLVAAFVAGWLALSPRVQLHEGRPRLPAAALAGLATLLAMLVGYYLAALLVQGKGERHAVVAFWATVAVIGGPLFGAAGGAWRTWPAPRRAIAAGMLGGALVGEAVTFMLLRTATLAGFFVIGAYGQGASVALTAEVAIGAAVAVALPRTNRERIVALITLVVASTVAAFGMALLIDAFERFG